MSLESGWRSEMHGSVSPALGFNQSMTFVPFISSDLRYKGDNAGYSTIHSWVRRHKGKPTQCVDCAVTQRLTWSNVDGRYRRQLGDYIARCRSCHARYDRRPEMLGAIARRWGKSVSIKRSVKTRGCAATTSRPLVCGGRDE